MNNGEQNKCPQGKSKLDMERKITKALLNKILDLSEHQKKQLALLLIASMLTELSIKDATELIKETQI